MHGSPCIWAKTTNEISFGGTEQKLAAWLTASCKKHCETVVYFFVVSYTAYNSKMLTAQKISPMRVSLPVRAARPSARNTVVCSVRKPEQQANLAQPVVAAVAAAMLMGAAMPDDALAARSGGRVGGTASRYMTMLLVWDVIMGYCVCVGSNGPRW